MSSRGLLRDYEPSDSLRLKHYTLYAIGGARAELCGETEKLSAVRQSVAGGGCGAAQGRSPGHHAMGSRHPSSGQLLLTLRSITSSVFAAFILPLLISLL